MDIQAVEKLANLVAHSSLYEISIKDGQDSIRVKNASFLSKQPTKTHNQTPMPNNTTGQALTNSNVTHHEKNLICSNHIGWLRLAKDTLAKPLVNVGDTVSVGQTLGYVGVLGKLEPIISDKAGRVQAILGENEQVVEYGTPLFKLG